MIRLALQANVIDAEVAFGLFVYEPRLAIPAGVRRNYIVNKINSHADTRHIHGALHDLVARPASLK
ncbi:hypothetical protein [Sphingomonas turrisvirgatae]|uniref:hypothetical protein n=1 Tax=Sphingomonas turrisvirgatae TaxID=1888892 RepID=UPI00156A8F0A|nr:hypothetical protein [Sphingomonas turrisvirgatae]